MLKYSAILKILLHMLYKICIYDKVYRHFVIKFHQICILLHYFKIKVCRNIQSEKLTKKSIPIIRPSGSGLGATLYILVLPPAGEV